MHHGLNPSTGATAPTPAAGVPSVPAGLAEFIDHGHDADTFADDVIRGLALPRKAIPPKYFYDAIGSRLFDRICDLPEYYPTRTEMAILRAHRGDFARLIGDDACLVEFGAGSLAKVRVLLDAMPRLKAFVALDISRDHLLDSAAALTDDYPRLRVAAVCADFTRPVTLPEVARRRRKVGFFPGSTIGNFEPEDAAAFLRTAAAELGRGGGLLIGVDLVKDPAVLTAAYNDRDGVTAGFNLNLLSRINRELCGSFEPRFFRHEAVWNADASRIEMHLVSRRRQRIHVAGRTFLFDEGETIHTENSYKYTTPGFHALAAGAGFQPVQTWTDAESLFSVHFFQVG